MSGLSLFELEKEGVFLSFSSDGEIRMKGDSDALKKFLPQIRENKDELIAELQMSEKAENEKIFAIERTDKTDKSTLVSLVSSLSGGKKSLFPDSRPKSETSWLWRVEFPDRDALTVAILPEPTRQEVLTLHPGAFEADPLEALPE
jgi:hypothetical protein